MPLIMWNDSLSVGLNEIDSQHKVLINLINDLNDAMKAGKGKEVAGKILTELLNYTHTHFGNEEKYFEKFKYPDTAGHIKLHRSFTDKIAEFKKDFESGKAGLSLQMMDFLSDWLREHIKGTDPKYVPLFKENGIK